MSHYECSCTNFGSFHSALHSQTIPSGLVPLNIFTCPYAIYQGMKQMCSDGLHAPVEHNTVLTLVHSLWTQKITACSQKDIEWLMLCWLGLWMSLCICTCRLALKLAELQGPLKRRYAKLQRSGTSLHQFWLLLLSEGRDTSCNFGDSSIMKRHQNWQFNPMFSKK